MPDVVGQGFDFLIFLSDKAVLSLYNVCKNILDKKICFCKTEGPYVSSIEHQYIGGSFSKWPEQKLQFGNDKYDIA